MMKLHNDLSQSADIASLRCLTVQSQAYCILHEIPLSSSGMTYSNSQLESRLAGCFCLFGLFLHMALSDPLLHTFGFNYSGDEGKFYEKIHPGTPFIFLSLFVLLWSRFNPIEKMLLIWKEHRAFALLLFVDCIAFLYMAARSGFAGLAFMIETHMNAVICAIVLSYTPASSCRKAVHIFIIVALMNAMLGTAESFWKFRLFDYDQGWYVLKETYFRASAFMGHPLDNAIFTSVALFIAIVAGYRKTITAFIVPILLLSLMAFGGRTALLFSLIGLIMLAASGLWQLGITKQMGMRHLLAFAALCLLTPLCIAGAAYLAMHNVIGERLAAHAFWDVSAGSRLLAFSVFHYMTEEEIIFGASPERVMDIIYRMNQVVPLNNIENPWIMMFMQLGLVMFPFWLFAMFAFLFRLMKDKPLALKFAVLAYIVIASASNSFGRKDANFAIMVSAVICSEKMTCSVKKNSQRTENYMLCE